MSEPVNVTPAVLVWNDQLECTHGERVFRIKTNSQSRFEEGPSRRGVLLQIWTGYIWCTLKFSDHNTPDEVARMKEWAKKGAEVDMRCFSDDEIDI